MECEKCAQDLTAYLDGELKLAEVREVESHIGGCPSCSRELGSLRESFVFVESHVRGLEPTTAMWNNLRARINQLDDPPEASQNPFQFFFLSHRVAATATVAITALIVLGLWSYNRYETSQQELRQYMSSYIESRDAHESVTVIPLPDSPRGTPGLHAVSDVDSIHTEFGENPFVDLKMETLSNPFRSEDR